MAVDSAVAKRGFCWGEAGGQTAATARAHSTACCSRQKAESGAAREKVKSSTSKGSVALVDEASWPAIAAEVAFSSSRTQGGQGRGQAAGQFGPQAGEIDGALVRAQKARQTQGHTLSRDRRRRAAHTLVGPGQRLGPQRQREATDQGADLGQHQLPPAVLELLLTRAGMGAIDHPIAIGQVVFHQGFDRLQHHFDGLGAGRNQLDMQQGFTVIGSDQLGHGRIAGQQRLQKTDLLAGIGNALLVHEGAVSQRDGLTQMEHLGHTG